MAHKMDIKCGHCYYVHYIAQQLIFRMWNDINLISAKPSYKISGVQK